MFRCIFLKISKVSYNIKNTPRLTTHTVQSMYYKTIQPSPTRDYQIIRYNYLANYILSIVWVTSQTYWEDDYSVSGSGEWGTHSKSRHHNAVDMDLSKMNQLWSTCFRDWERRKKAKDMSFYCLCLLHFTRIGWGQANAPSVSLLVGNCPCSSWGGRVVIYLQWNWYQDRQGDLLVNYSVPDYQLQHYWFTKEIF